MHLAHPCGLLVGGCVTHTPPSSACVRVATRFDRVATRFDRVATLSIALPSQSRAETIADMEEGRYARLRALGGIAFVSLPPSEYASALEATLRTGRCELDFRDEDGVCVCFLHGGELYLRTACGAVKGVVDMNSLANMECVVMSPRGRFIEHCRKRGVTAEQYMNFAALLNNDALLDCVAAYKPANQTHHAFVYVFKGQPLSGATAAAMCSNLVQCCTTHTVFAAGVRRPDVDVGRLMNLVRRAHNADTLRLLTKTDVADACIVRLTINDAEHAASAAVAAAAAPRGASHTDPRQRLLDYTATYGVDAADATAFADALANEDRLDTVMLSKESGGTVFILPVRQTLEGPMSEEQAHLFAQELAHLIASWPPRLLAATTMAVFDASADVDDIAARLRSRDPWRMRSMLKAIDGFQVFIERREGKVPLQSTDTARACAACARRDGATGSGGGGASGPIKLRMCSGCGLVLYCGVACQVAHWKEHKAVCKKKKKESTGEK